MEWFTTQSRHVIHHNVTIWYYCVIIIFFVLFIYWVFCFLYSCGLLMSAGTMSDPSDTYGHICVGKVYLCRVQVNFLMGTIKYLSVHLSRFFPNSQFSDNVVTLRLLDKFQDCFSLDLQVRVLQFCNPWKVLVSVTEMLGKVWPTISTSLMGNSKIVLKK